MSCFSFSLKQPVSLWHNFATSISYRLSNQSLTMTVSLCQIHVDNENALYTQYRKCSKDFVLSVDVQYSYYIHVCALLSCLELHLSKVIRMHMT